MRAVKIVLILVMLLGTAYAVSMYFVDENNDFTLENEVHYPVDKVFPQFNNLENFSRWSTFFSDHPNLSLQFFSPYEGKGSALAYRDQENADFFGDLFIRFVNPYRTIKYQLFEGKKNTPYTIDVKFIPFNGKTKIIWYIHTPKQPYLKRSLNLISEDFWVETTNKSITNLQRILSNKVDQDLQRENLKLDTLLIEKQDGQILLGVNVTAKNTKDVLFKNIVLNHNKVRNYVKMDLGKKEDEFGEAVFIADADHFKDKEISYFYGIPLSKKMGLSDNSFTFRTLNPSTNYVIFYKGSYSGRVSAIQQLLNKAKKDTMRFGEIRQTFVEEPISENNTLMKLSLPVYK